MGPCPARYINKETKAHKQNEQKGQKKPETGKEII